MGKEALLWRGGIETVRRYNFRECCNDEDIMLVATARGAQSVLFIARRAMAGK